MKEQQKVNANLKINACGRNDCLSSDSCLRFVIGKKVGCLKNFPFGDHLPKNKQKCSGYIRVHDGNIHAFS